MIEYSFDTTVNYLVKEIDLIATDWYPSLDVCLVAVKKLIEEHPDAQSFVFSIVQRSHAIPMSQRLR